MLSRGFIITILCFLPFNGQKIDDYNIPEPVRRCFDRVEMDNYEIAGRINPFYLRGDFNADGKIDYAVNTVNTTTNKRGVAMCEGGETLRGIVLGPQIPLAYPDGMTINHLDFSAWRVFEDSVILPIPGEPPPPTLSSEAILLIWPEMGSGLIYWDGRKYAWYTYAD